MPFIIIETRSTNPALTPDTTQIQPNEPLVKVWLIPMTGTPREILQTAKYHDLYYSPDLSKFVYENQVEEDQPAELHVVNKDGLKDQILYITKDAESNHDISFHGWSPDSKSVIFEEMGDELTWMDLEKTSITNISFPKEEPPELTSLVWLDSSHLVASRHTVNGIWLAVPGEEYIQIAKLSDSDLDPFYFANGFDVFLDK